MASANTVTSGVVYTHTDSADLTTGVRKRMVEDFIYSTDPKEYPMREIFGGYESFNPGSTSFEFAEDNHVALKTTMSTTSVTAWNSSTTIVDLEVADASIFCGGDIILTANGELVIVDFTVANIDESGNTIHVLARGDLGSTESNANSTSDVLLIVGNCQLEGFTYGQYPRFTLRTTKTNYTQIMNEDISVSKSYNQVPKYGIKDEFKYQIKQATIRQLKKLEMNLLYGNPNSGTLEGSATQPRTFGGIIGVGTTATHMNIQTNTTDLSAADVSEDDINTEIQACFDAGASYTDYILICNSYNKKLISGFMTPYRRTDFAEKTYGGTVSAYECDFGKLDIMMNRYMKQSDILILPKANFKIGAYRPFKYHDLPDTKDAFMGSITGEYTCKLTNEEFCAYIYDTSTS
jgi:hypothetical protein